MKMNQAAWYASRFGITGWDSQSDFNINFNYAYLIFFLYYYIHELPQSQVVAGAEKIAIAVHTKSE